MPDRPTCKDCRFWDFHTDPDQVAYAALGHCKRRSPRQFRYGETNKMEASEWPATRPEDWCGEHEPHGSDAEAPKLKTEYIEGAGWVTNYA